MRLLNFKQTVLFVAFALINVSICMAQDGQLNINQDQEIDALLELKKDINKSDNDNRRYKIQIYSGSRGSAENARSKYLNSIGKWRSTLEYETPNYKVWVGSFNTSLEADRALVKVQKKFPSAFKFKPKKEKDD